jgi:hypothetical protein
MNKLTTRLIIALFTFLLGMAATVVWLAHCRSSEGVPQDGNVSRVGHGNQELRLIIPKDTWEPIFFKSINERTTGANLPSLRTVTLPQNDFEVRVWVGFGLNGIDGFILRRSTNEWIAIHLHEMSERPPYGKYQRNLEAPKSGWGSAWQKLVDAGILTLPDASEVNCEGGINDGKSYVVEINKDRVYRTYMYDNPNFAKCGEAQQMIEIGEIIADEFDLEDFRIRK